MTKTYRSEFPEFGEIPEAAQLIALGFSDISWHNDTCPSFVSADLKTRIWVEHENFRMREDQEDERFCITHGDFSEGNNEVTDFQYYEEFADVLTYLQKRA